MISVEQVKALLDRLPEEEQKAEKYEQAILFIKDKMTMMQLSALDGIEWFLYGGRGTGRTYVACVAVIDRALRFPNVAIHIYDHYNYPRVMNNYLLDMIRKMINENPFLDLDNFKINSSSMTITYMENTYDKI